MSNPLKVKVLIEVNEQYSEIFAYKNVVEIETFSKAKLLEVLSDITGDINVLVNRSVSMQKVEDKNLLTDGN